MTNYQSPTQAIVMQRVRSIYFMQLFLVPIALSAFVLLLALWGIGREVWVARVFQNMPALSPAHMDAIVNFFAVAFLNTRFVVRVLVILTLGAFTWFAYTIFQLLRSRTYGVRGNFI